MDGLDLGIRRKRSLKERMGLKGMGCCGGPIWGFGATTLPVRDDDDDEGEAPEGDAEIHHQLPQLAAAAVEMETEEEDQPETRADRNTACGPEPEDRSNTVSVGMNLAAALAAERQYRACQEPEAANEEEQLQEGNRNGVSPETPARVSLMRLLEEAEEKVEVVDSVCCVCMGRKKGAAFIPCGHTFCRVCSRELWLNRGTCPLCNRAILEILDIF